MRIETHVCALTKWKRYKVKVREFSCVVYKNYEVDGIDGNKCEGLSKEVIKEGRRHCGMK